MVPSVKIPLFDTVASVRDLRGEIDAAITSVIDNGRYILGPEVAAFEREFAAYIGAEHAVGVGNGTDAITIALRALGVLPGDDVIVPSFSFFASAEAIPPIGARPVFCDIDPTTFNVTAETVERALTLQTRAIVVVHLFGSPAPVDAIRALAAPLGVKVLEDSAQSVGARVGESASGDPGGGRVGALGDAATFSFFPSKNLGAFGDGGMITTTDADVAERARRLRLHGSLDKRMHSEIGYNSRLDELQAAILRVLLPHLDRWNAGRRAAAAAYAEAGVFALASPQRHLSGAEPVFHLYSVTAPQPDRLAAELARRGVEARGYYRRPIHRQPAMRGFAVGAGELPGTVAAAAGNLALPISPTMTRGQVEQVVGALGDAVAELPADARA